MKGSLVVALTVVAVAGAAPSALAATVHVEITTDYEYRVGPVEIRTVVYTAATGEANDLTVRSGGGIVLRDEGAKLTAGSGCEKQPNEDVVCDGQQVRVSLGDGSDRAEVGQSESDGFFASVDGGPGNDTLSGTNQFGVGLDGGSGDDTLTGSDIGIDSLYGGPGDDSLRGAGKTDFLDGGGGQDTLLGGDGDDQLTDGDHRDRGGKPDPSVPIDSDVLDGGPGSDSVDYRTREGAVVVDLSGPPTGGEPNEEDTVRRVETVYGGHGPDRLVGDAGANSLNGGPGNDYLDGGAGNDNLDGQDGDDVLAGGTGDDSLGGGRGLDQMDGGGGNDYVVSGDGNPKTETVLCGDGVDKVLSERVDLLVPDCEQATSLTRLTVAAQPLHVTRKGRVVFPLHCPASAVRGCEDTLILSKGHRRLGKRGRRTEPDTETAITVRLTRRQVARLAGRRIRVTMKRRNARGSAPQKRKAAWTIVLPLPEN